MKRKLILLIFIGIYVLPVFAQEYKRSNVWAVGSDPVVKFNFNIGININVVDNISTIPYCILESSSSSVSDTNGKLLFFSNGFFLYDSSGYAMDNGLFVNCPYGNILANYYGASLFNQTSIILPKKGNTHYVFSTGMSDSVANNYLNHVLTEFDVLNYCVVDMDSNGGLGKVVQKNVVLADKQHYVNCAMQAVKHSNGKDWWLVKADCMNNRYQEYLVKEDTILGPFYQTITNTGDFCYWFGQIYFSNDGTKMASGIYGNIINGSFYYRNGVDIFDFDRCNGNLTFKKNYRVPEDTSTYTNYDIQMGICFSPNDSLLYMSNTYSVYQIDLEDTNTNNALFIQGPDTTDLSYFPEYNTLASAPDGKIYIGNFNGIRKTMSFIDSPNVKGMGCHFVSQGVWQPYTNLRSPPNMPNYGLGADTSIICWPLGSNEIMDLGNEIIVYPNPASKKVYIKYANTQKLQIELYNTIGELLHTTKNKEMEVSAFPEGMYFIKIGNTVKKIIIE